jgi:hypothetical protein
MEDQAVRPQAIRTQRPLSGRRDRNNSSVRVLRYIESSGKGKMANFRVLTSATGDPVWTS